MERKLYFAVLFGPLLLSGIFPTGCASRGSPSRLSTRVIAHRGYWNIESENSAQNSIRSLELADRLGVYGSEFDVHLTKDNVPVVYHDDELYGTDIAIQRTDYNDIKNFKLPNGELIPRLDQYLDKGKELNIMLILELKEHENAERDREAASIVVGMVKEKNMEKRVEYITFSLEGGKELVRLAPGSSVSYLNGDLSPKELKDMGFSGLDYDSLVMDDHPEYFTEAKNLGLIVNVWTVNSIGTAMEIAKLGADFITTDIPDKAKTALAQ